MAKKDLLKGEKRQKKIQQIRDILDNTYGEAEAPRIYCIERRSSAGRRSYDVYCIHYREGQDGLSIPYLWYLNGDIAALSNVRRNKHREIVITGGNFSGEQEIAGLLSLALYGNISAIRHERL